MIAIALIGVAAATMTDFNLAAYAPPRSLAQLTASNSKRTRSGFRYSAAKWEEPTADNGEGIRVKLKWKRVRLTVPFGQN